MAVNEVEMKVFLKNDNPVEFDLVPDPPLPQGPGDNDFIFSNDGKNGFMLRFVLQDQTNSNSPLAAYRFPDDKDEALYSAKGMGCPRTKGQWAQFKAKEVETGNKILVVRNLNQYKEKFGYTLRLTKTPHNPNPDCIDLDPGGENTNGSSRSILEYATVTTIGVMAGVFSAIVTTVALAKMDMVCPVGPGF
jgi:hypothetical protein